MSDFSTDPSAGFARALIAGAAEPVIERRIHTRGADAVIGPGLGCDLQRKAQTAQAAPGAAAEKV